MDRNHAAELLRQFILEHDLPRTELALFGIRCPYCGKSDRIHGLEAPGRVTGCLPDEAVARYTELWGALAAGDERLGLCRFCQNVLLLDGRQRALPLYQ
jgi:hypothetical protein